MAKKCSKGLRVINDIDCPASAPHSIRLKSENVMHKSDDILVIFAFVRVETEVMFFARIALSGIVAEQAHQLRCDQYLLRERVRMACPGEPARHTSACLPEPDRPLGVSCHCSDSRLRV